MVGIYICISRRHNNVKHLHQHIHTRKSTRHTHTPHTNRHTHNHTHTNTHTNTHTHKHTKQFHTPAIGNLRHLASRSERVDEVMFLLIAQPLAAPINSNTVPPYGKQNVCLIISFFQQFSKEF